MLTRRRLPTENSPRLRAARVLYHIGAHADRKRRPLRLFANFEIFAFKTAKRSLAEKQMSSPKLALRSAHLHLLLRATHHTEAQRHRELRGWGREEYKLRSVGLSRRRLRALRVRLRRISPPLRFGAFPLRRMDYALHLTFINTQPHLPCFISAASQQEI